MPPLPIADWQAALAEMETALGATLTALDRYQAGWHTVLAEHAPAADVAPDAPLARLEARLGEWNARLTAAAELAASVERELNDREAAVGRWQELFTRWREVLQRGVEPQTPADRTDGD